jgi:hypothetical protein
MCIRSLVTTAAAVQQQASTGSITPAAGTASEPGCPAAAPVVIVVALWRVGPVSAEIACPGAADARKRSHSWEEEGHGGIPTTHLVKSRGNYIVNIERGTKSWSSHRRHIQW